jgi:hypothetical protein
MVAPDVFHIMTFVAHHVNLLILHMCVPLERSALLHSRIVAGAESCLEVIVTSIGFKARFLCRTVCGMICWAAVIMLKVS